MNIVVYSFLSLVGLFILSLITSVVLNIRNNKLYNYFHFIGGFLMALFIFSFLTDYFSIIPSISIDIAVIFLVLGIGVMWEIGEWGLWKYFLKKKKYRPEKQDTINDICLDVIGALAGVIFF